MLTVSEALARFLSVRHYSRFSLKAVLFDMDGVLFDSMKNHTLAWHKAVSGEGIPCERNEFYRYEGSTGAGTIHSLFQRTYGRNATPGEVDRIYGEKSRYFNEMAEPEPMPGAKEILEQVVGAGLKPVLVTGSGQNSLLERLEKIYPATFLPEYRVTAFDVRNGKPHPEPYLKGLEKAGVRAWEALVIENAPLGVEAAHHAGIFTIAVNTGPLSEESLWEAGADRVYPDMPALSADFQEIIRHMLPSVNAEIRLS